MGAGTHICDCMLYSVDASILAQLGSPITPRIPIPRKWFVPRVRVRLCVNFPPFQYLEGSSVIVIEHTEFPTARRDLYTPPQRGCNLHSEVRETGA